MARFAGSVETLQELREIPRHILNQVENIFYAVGESARFYMWNNSVTLTLGEVAVSHVDEGAGTWIQVGERIHRNSGDPTATIPSPNAALLPLRYENTSNSSLWYKGSASSLWIREA